MIWAMRSLLAIQSGLQAGCGAHSRFLRTCVDKAPVSEPGKIEFYTKTSFLVIQVEIGEV